MASHKLAAPLDVLLAKAHAPLSLEILVDLLMVFVAAAGCAAVFMVWFGHGMHLRHRLTFALGLSFALWTLFSFMQLGALYNWAPILWQLAPYSAAELAAGFALVWVAVFTVAKIIDLLPRRRPAAGMS